MTVSQHGVAAIDELLYFGAFLFLVTGHADKRQHAKPRQLFPSLRRFVNA